jgi:hypothetical protein
VTAACIHIYGFKHSIHVFHGMKEATHYEAESQLEW